jgi:hypothetical protein
MLEAELDEIPTLRINAREMIDRILGDCEIIKG